MSNMNSEVLTLETKIQGCLTGAILGTELGLQRRLIGQPSVEPSKAHEVLDLELPWRETPAPNPTGAWNASFTPLLTSVARAYLRVGDRIQPEDWATELKNTPPIAGNPAFWHMDVHTTVELLREGMHPRLSGLGAVPTGSVSAAIIPVGIYHAGDPEGAYLDAVEIASVTQRTPAVEWAALTAAAVAQAFMPDATPDTVVEAVLKIAHRHAREVFYIIERMVKEARMARQRYPDAAEGQAEFLRQYAVKNGPEWVVSYGENPIGWVLTLLAGLDPEPKRLVTTAVVLDAYPEVRASVAGAIVGALYGIQAFPQGWVEAVRSLAEPLFGLSEIVRKKLGKERAIIREIEQVAQAERNGVSMLTDKVYGCILAGAIGNAMGSVVECQTYQEIDERHPGGVNTVLDPSRLESEDDNQMAMLLTETYIERDGYPATARDFGRTWQNKLNRAMFFYCMKNSYDLICGGMDPRITGHWSMVTGSTVMCMEPVGTYHLGDPRNAYIDATGISYMYQRGLDVVAASILAASVAEAFRAEGTVDSVLQAALDAAPKTKMLTFDTRAIDTPYDFIARCLEVADKYTDVLAARAELYEKCLYYHCIDPLELLGLSYAMLKISGGDVRQAAIGGTNIGRDADTIAGRAAMLSGTIFGSAGIPAEWIALFKPESLGRIRTNAGRIADLLTNKKLPNMQIRQQVVRD